MKKEGVAGHDVCVVIPAYNNEGTIMEVVRRVRCMTDDVIIVNDGSTDSTSVLLKELPPCITIVSYPQNRGKGYALRTGFLRAMEQGYRYAVTLDADGQHFPEDIPLFMKAHKAHPDALIIGSRGVVHDHMPKKNTFANRFSNFWFFIQTGWRLPDTQTGYRLYPMKKIYYTGLITSRYEAELEMLVLSAWSGMKLIPIDVRVYYPPKEERITHFRPVADFVRISILNTVLCFLAVFYWISHPFVLLIKRRKA